MPYALSTSTCGLRRSSSVQFMPSRSASPWKLTSRRRWLRSRVRSIDIAIRVILPSDLERARRGHPIEHTPGHARSTLGDVVSTEAGCPMSDLIAVACDDRATAERVRDDGALTDLGVDDRFMKELGENLPENGAALILLVRKVTPD